MLFVKATKSGTWAQPGNAGSEHVQITEGESYSLSDKTAAMLVEIGAAEMIEEVKKKPAKRPSKKTAKKG